MCISMKNNKITIVNAVLGAALVCSLMVKIVPAVTSFDTSAAAVSSSGGGHWHPAGQCRGYAVYRDGVPGNVNLYHHAGLMDENNLRCYKPIIHAGGNAYTVDWAYYDQYENNFLAGNNFIGVYCPKNCSMTDAQKDSFVATARELRGTPYVLTSQISYSAGDNTWVYPENVTALRCDGLVEYVYEWYGFRVGGGDNTWDITRNLSSNRSAHNLWNITPKKQHESLLEYAGGYSLIQ